MAKLFCSFGRRLFGKLIRRLFFQRLIKERIFRRQLFRRQLFRRQLFSQLVQEPFFRRLIGQRLFSGRSTSRQWCVRWVPTSFGVPSHRLAKGQFVGLRVRGALTLPPALSLRLNLRRCSLI